MIGETFILGFLSMMSIVIAKRMITFSFQGLLSFTILFVLSTVAISAGQLHGTFNTEFMIGVLVGFVFVIFTW